MCRFFFLKESVPRLLELAAVHHVLIVDETGEDAAAIWAEPWGDHPKLGIIINEVRVGIFENKRRCLAAAPTDWVLILDSDNEWTADSFAALEAETGGRLDNRYIYAAGGMIRRTSGQKDTRPLELFGSIDVDRGNWNTMLGTPGAYELLNDGNFVLHRDALNVIPRGVPHERFRAADVLACLHMLVGAGFTLRVLESVSYIHNVHDKSSWLQESAESWNIMKRGWTMGP
jgi:hypothetical protein